MGNGNCCKRSERVDTLVLDEESTLNRDAKRHYDPQLGVPAQMISLSDSDDEYNDSPQTKKKLGRFKEHQKSSQLSTGQLPSQQSIKSELQFSNFITFQALPSAQNINQAAFSRLQLNFQAEMTELATFQQTTQCNHNNNNQKKVQFNIPQSNK